MENKCLVYKSRIPSCGIDSNNCPHFIREREQIEGAEKDCKKCKTIFKCNVEKKGLHYCFECPKYPCSKFQKFAKIWPKHGVDLYDNQQKIKKEGKGGVLRLIPQ